MHVPEGFLSPEVYLPAYALSLPLWFFSFRKFYERFEEEFPFILALTSFSFVIQSIMIPLPGSTSAHAVGVFVIACLYGPSVAFLCETLILIANSLFLGKGGLTVLPVNALSVGFLGPVASWVVFNLMKGFSRRARVFVASWLGTAISSLSIGMFLSLQHYLDTSFFSIPPEVLLPSLLIPHLLFVGVAEGVYSVLVMGILQRFRGRLSWNV